MAGQGVFARIDIVKGQVLGAYPGVVRSADSMLRKSLLAPNCKRYAFQTDLNMWLDPTDSEGLLRNNPSCSIFGLGSDASMAYVNEPPLDYAVNVEIVDGTGKFDLVFKATCGIPAGSELFLDYGRKYDRSAYGK